MQRVASLDILRFVAVVLVLGRHMVPFPQTSHPLLKFCMDLWMEWGSVGVDLFFALSGFLVSGLLFEEYKAQGTVRIARFFWRRGWKIYPAFYFFLFATLGLFYLLGRQFPLRHVISEVCFVQNYNAPVWSHTWSLAVEEHFYLLIGLLIYILTSGARPNGLRQNSLSLIVPIGVTICVTALALRTLAVWLEPESIAPGFLTHYRIDGLFYGVLASYWRHFHPLSWHEAARHRRFWIAFALVCFAPQLILIGLNLGFPNSGWNQISGRYQLTLGFTLHALGTCSLLLLTVPALHHDAEANNINQKRWLNNIAFLGRHSYSIYLWHMPVQVWLLSVLLRMHVTPEISLIVYLVASFLVGVGMSQLIEIPCLRLRESWFPHSRIQLVPQSVFRIQ